MKRIIHLLLERLFETISFSNKSETLKAYLEKTLSDEYDERKAEGENEIEIIRDMLDDFHDIKVLSSKYNIDDESIEEIISSEGILSQTEVRKSFKKYKRYIITLALCGMFLLNLLYNTVCYFSIGSLLLNLLVAGAVLVVFKRKKRFLIHAHFFEYKMDVPGREYIKKMHDRYAKKSINSICTLIAFVFYVLFTLVLSVFSSQYNTNDILQQISYNNSILFLLLFFVLKNVMCIGSLEKFFIEDRAVHFRNQLRKIVLCSVGYWLVFDCIFMLFSNKIGAIFNVYILTVCFYFILLFVYNISLRKQLVFKNIVVNIKRIITVSMAVIVAVLYVVMSGDTYFTQPYINKVSVVKHNTNPVSYNEDTGVYTITTDKNDFKVLQLTDVHLGGSLFSAKQDIKALDACYTLIKETQPDFVVVTGDIVFPMGIMSFSLNNRAPVEQFAAFMRNTGIPWAFTYGNHDTESMACITADEFDDLMKSLSFKNSANLLYPYIQPDVYGRNNQMIEVRNADGTLMQALFLIDSNDYNPEGSGINEYDYIRDDQVEWYKKNVIALNEREGRVVDSMIFFHIPLQEYKEANALYEEGSGAVTYYYGILGETMINKICCPDHPSRLFDAAVELGSTKAMFCGHDHYNNQSLEYKGIRLTYGYSIDYLAMPGIEDDVEQRGATLITINKSGGFEIEPYRLIDIK